MDSLVEISPLRCSSGSEDDSFDRDETPFSSAPEKKNLDFIIQKFRAITLCPPSSAEYIPSSPSSSSSASPKTPHESETDLANLQGEHRLSLFGMSIDQNTTPTQATIHKLNRIMKILAALQKKPYSSLEEMPSGTVKKLLDTAIEENEASLAEGSYIYETPVVSSSKAKEQEGRKLRGIFCTQLKLTFIPEKFFESQTVTHIDFSENMLLYLSPSIQKFKQLTTLKLEENCLEKLPESFGTLESLEEFYGSGNAFTDVPTSFSQLTSLQTLVLDNNFFRSIPKPILCLPALTCLSMRNCLLVSLPEELGLMPSLRYVYFGYNGISKLSDSLCTKVHILDMTHNELTEVPQSIAKSKTLSELYLAKNAIKALPDLSQTSLTILDIDTTQIQQTPSLPRCLVKLF
jgi:Leucine-rich repeat (LRR) protein